MNGYLLDSCTISMLAPDKPRPPGFEAWLQREDDRLYLSIVSLHEIAKGIAKLNAKGATRRAGDLQGWFNQTLTDLADSILGYGNETALLAGELEGLVQAAGHGPGMGDAMIAAIARQNDLVVVTDNVKHFQAFTAHGVTVMTPQDVVAAPPPPRQAGTTPPPTKRARPARKSAKAVKSPKPKVVRAGWTVTIRKPRPTTKPTAPRPKR